ncbi:MAG: glutathione S-transferase family protein [Burkholderiales bacterium]|nr:glutathione S-transferase family protein [Burkholderiales bacterium]
MGLLIEGVWHDRGYETRKTAGRFQRQPTQFRNWITPGGSPGPSGKGGFAAEPGRYHLYVSYACPWAHRTLIYRALKGLETAVSLSVVHWHMGEHGWTFDAGEGVVPDTVNGSRFLHEIYTRAEPRYTGRVSVPVLWDKRTGTIVSNESSEIIRMFNSAFDGVGARAGNYYPARLGAEIDALNARIYETVNNGVYRCGFATSQEAYDEAVAPLFESLDWLDARLADRRYLCGGAPTEADWRLLPTLLRFDLVYFGLFKCNLRRIADYAHLSQYLRDLYQHPGIAATVNIGHVRRHYYGLRHVNPSGVVPVGPRIDLDAPHDRARLASVS